MPKKDFSKKKSEIDSGKSYQRNRSQRATSKMGNTREIDKEAHKTPKSKSLVSKFHKLNEERSTNSKSWHPSFFNTCKIKLEKLRYEHFTRNLATTLSKKLCRNSKYYKNRLGKFSKKLKNSLKTISLLFNRLKYFVLSNFKKAKRLHNANLFFKQWAFGRIYLKHSRSNNYQSNFPNTLDSSTLKVRKNIFLNYLKEGYHEKNWSCSNMVSPFGHKRIKQRNSEVNGCFSKCGSVMLMTKVFTFLSPSDIPKVSVASQQFYKISKMPLSWAQLDSKTFQKILAIPDVLAKSICSRLSKIETLNLDFSFITKDSSSNPNVLSYLEKSIVVLENLSIVIPDWDYKMGITSIDPRRYSEKDINQFLENLIDSNQNSLQCLKLVREGTTRFRTFDFSHPRLRLPKYLPSLKSFQISTPFWVPVGFQMKSCSFASLKELQMVSNDEIQHTVKLFLNGISNSAQNIELYGKNRICCFNNDLYFTNLKSLQLGWTSYSELRMLDDLIPSHFPKLGKLSLYGPHESGLTDTHLRIYTKLNRFSPYGVYFKYKRLNLTFACLVNFRCSLKSHGLFALFTDHSDRIYHLNIQGFQDRSPPKKEIEDLFNKNFDRIEIWRQIFKYEFLDKELFISPNSLDKEIENNPNKTDNETWDKSQFGNICTYAFPQVGVQMQGYDLFCLEMSLAPKICADLNEDNLLKELWTDLPSHYRAAYEGPILRAYIEERCRVDEWSFSTSRPCWE